MFILTVNQSILTVFGFMQRINITKTFQNSQEKRCWISILQKKHNNHSDIIFRILFYNQILFFKSALQLSVSHFFKLLYNSVFLKSEAL